MKSVSAATIETAYVAALEPLTIAEQELLRRAEETINNNYAGFMSAAAALRDICVHRWYRETDNSWQAYCERRWGISGRHGYRQIEAANTMDRIGAAVGEINEATARALGSFEEEIQKAVYQVALATATKGSDGKPIITAAHIRAVGDQITGWVVSGGMDNGHGDVQTIGVLTKAHVTEDVYERMLRQSSHIREKLEAKNGSGNGNGSKSPSETFSSTDPPRTTSSGSKLSLAKQDQGETEAQESVSAPVLEDPPVRAFRNQIDVPESASSAGTPDLWTRAIEQQLDMFAELVQINDKHLGNLAGVMPTKVIIRAYVSHVRRDRELGHQLIISDKKKVAACGGCEAQETETTKAYYTMVEGEKISSQKWDLCERCTGLYLKVIQLIGGVTK